MPDGGGQSLVSFQFARQVFKTRGRSADYTSGNLSTFTNGSVDHYDYAVAPNCIFYYGTKNNCYRANNISMFMSNYLMYGSSLYTIIYIESEIVAVLPYGADY